MLMILVSLALAQCTKDTECKGDRICNAGVCIDATLRVPLTAPVEPPAVESEARLEAEKIRVLKMGRIERELKDLREQLDDATLAGPIVKLIFATIFAGTAISALGIYVDQKACFERGASWCSGDYTAALTTLSLAVPASIAWCLWGGFQLRSRLSDRQSLPIEIAEKELELAQIRAQR